MARNSSGDDIRVYGNEKTVYINTLLNVIDTDTTFTYQAASTVDVNGQNVLTNNYFGAKNIENSSTGDANYVLDDDGDERETKRAAIIAEVDSIAVGVDNVSIEVTNLTESYIETNTDYDKLTASAGDGDLTFPKSEIYTLYNRNGTVVAAVTIGEDSGSNSKFAFFTEATPSKESYITDDDARATSSNGYWVWERKAIVDGKEVILTEKGDTLWELSAKRDGGNLALNDLAEIRYDANGYVRRANNLTKFTSNAVGGGSLFADPSYPEYVTDIEDFEDVIEDEKVAVLYANYANSGVQGDDYKLSYEEGILYVVDKDSTETTSNTGFYVQGANVIVSRSKVNSGGSHGNVNGVTMHDKITDTYTGENAMSRALAALDGNRKSGGNTIGFYGYIIAIAENSCVTSVILIDTWGREVDGGVASGPSTKMENSRVRLDQVQALLDAGGHVTIPSNWQPTDVTNGDYWELEIKAPAVLEVEGIFDATGRVEITGDGKLIVGKTFIAESANFEDDEINIDIDAKDFRLTLDDDLDINGNVTVHNDLELSGTGSETITVSEGATVTVEGDLENDDGIDFTIEGEMTVKGDPVSPTTAYEIEVLSENSLYIEGTLGADVTVTVGDGDNAGYAKIAKVDGGTVNIVKISDNARKVPEITTLIAGEVEIGANTKAKITSIAATKDKEVEITVGEGATLAVTNDVKATGSGASVSIEAEGENATIDIGGGVEATSGSSGSASVEITSEAKGTVVNVKKNTSASASGGGSASVSIEVSGDGSAVDVKGSNVATGSGATAEIEVSGEGTTAHVGTVDSDDGTSSVTVGTGAAADIDYVDAGTVKVTGTGTATVDKATDEAEFDTDEVDGGGIDVGEIETEEGAEPITFELMFMYNSGDFLEYSDSEGNKIQDLGGFIDEGERGGYSTLPWVYALIYEGADEDATVTDIDVILPGKTAAQDVLYEGAAYNDYDVKGGGTEVGQRTAAHWEMKRSTAEETFSLPQDEVATGKYTFVFTVKLGSGATTKIEASATWDKTVEPWDDFNQAETGEDSGN